MNQMCETYQKYECPTCHKSFTRPYDVRRHHTSIHRRSLSPETPLNKIMISGDQIKKFKCHVCDKILSRKSILQKHLLSHGIIDTLSKGSSEHSHSLITPQKTTETLEHLESIGQSGTVSPTTIDHLVTKINQLQHELQLRDERIKHEFKQMDEKIKNTPPSNILNVICVTGNDDYLDMLTAGLGNQELAIDYVKNCALSHLTGDCRLIEKIYTDSTGAMIFSLDKGQSKIVYQDDQHQVIKENMDQFGRKLAGNLQNSYLKGVNYLIQRNLDHKTNPNHFLEHNDLLAWNHHIYQLSDVSHQRKIMDHLNIPCV